MSRSFLVICLLALLSACSSPSGPAPGTTGRMLGEGPPSGPSPANSEDSGATVVSVIGTPFYLIFKLPVCAFNLIAAAPVAGAAELGDRPADKAETKQDLADDVAESCGPPYWVER